MATTPGDMASNTRARKLAYQEAQRTVGGVAGAIQAVRAEGGVLTNEEDLIKTAADFGYTKEQALQVFKENPLTGAAIQLDYAAKELVKAAHEFHK